MRIAVSGTHSTGKSTLVAALGERLPDHAIVAEPYEVLAERGYEFAHPPSREDPAPGGVPAPVPGRWCAQSRSTSMPLHAC